MDIVILMAPGVHAAGRVEVDIVQDHENVTNRNMEENHAQEPLWKLNHVNLILAQVPNLYMHFKVRIITNVKNSIDNC